MSLTVIWTATHPDAVPLSRAYDDDAGFDLTCIQDMAVPPGESRKVRSGIAIAMPPGWWGRIVARSSTWTKRGFMIIEGVIDAGFRGELYVQVYNPSDRPKLVTNGERLAQLLFLPAPNVHLEERLELPSSERGENGFGSSG